MTNSGFKESERNLRKQFKSFNDGHKQAHQILVELFNMYKEQKGLPKDQITVLKKVVQASANEVESEISFLHVSMGVQEIEKFL